MSIEAMPAVLSWTDGRAAMERVHERYESHVTSALWETVERIRGWNRQLAARLDRAVAGADHDELQRVLLAPETTNRLLRRGPYVHGADDAEVGRFLHRSFLAEAARAGRAVGSQDSVWTALGDGRLLPGGEFLPGPSIPAFIPIDFDSPHAATSGPIARQEDGPAEHAVLDGDERRLALGHLTAARDVMRKTPSSVDAFVSRFTKVLVVRHSDQGDGGPLPSDACGQWIGRSAFGGLHAAGVDGDRLAEAIVRQAVHSYLNVQELLEPRVLGPAAYETGSRVRSPWTERPLPVRSFLRECFVQYGLLNFWCLVLGVGASDPEWARERVRDTLRGFVAVPLLDAASAHAAMSDEARTAMGQMQEVVASCFDAIVA